MNVSNAKARNGVIFVFDKKGEQIACLLRQNHKRMSGQAASDHRIMDKFKATHPEAHKALLDWGGEEWFTFNRHGQSGQWGQPL